MTEIQFLISLLLEHKLPEAVKTKLIARIGDVEKELGYRQPQAQRSAIQPAVSVNGAVQAPSFAAAMNRGPTDKSQPPSPEVIAQAMSVSAPIVDRATIVASPSAAAAIASRQTAIMAAQNDLMKPEPGRTGPRKF